MDTNEEYTRKIIEDNGIIVTKDDPLFALITIMRKFESDLQQEKETQLNKFLEKLQLEYQKMDQVTKERAEKILSIFYNQSNKNLEKILEAIKNESKMLEVTPSIRCGEVTFHPLWWVSLFCNLVLALCCLFLVLR